ncbi:MAG: PEP-CTERM sorting domain-containing protein [Candidatus Acidiferrum sp.]
MKLRLTLFALTLVVATCFVASAARADQIDTVTMTFASGATFAGSVTFAPGLLSVTGVDGILTGYQLGSAGPSLVPGSTDAISWVWPGQILTDPSTITTWLGDGTGFASYDPLVSNLIQFAYDSATGMFVSTGDPFTDNGVLYIDPNVGNVLDPMTTGKIAPVPEPTSLLLLGVGLASLLGAKSRKRSGQVAQ